jgi:acetyl-CoA C-acetyltransferase
MQPVREIVICEPLRTPIGRFGGGFKGVTAAELGAVALRGIISRAGINPADIDDVVLGHCNASSDAPSIGRVVALDAGLPVSVPGYHLDRRCGSGLQAVLSAAMQVQSSMVDVVAAGGAESMSNATFYSTAIRWGRRGGDLALHDSLARARVTAGGRDYPVAGGMVETAENLAEEFGISREEQDAFAVESHRRATAAQDGGLFDQEIVPVEVPAKRGENTLVTRDEHPRADASRDKLAQLRPIMELERPGATVTAGNSSGQNDAAAMCLVTHRDRAEELGLRPLARLVSWAVVGVPPRTMGIGPVPAAAMALEKAGLTMADMDLIELNEAFAAQTLAVTRKWGFGKDDFARMNVNGSGISLGHPVGATGARILVSLAREMHRRSADYALETMCIGGGQGLAAIFARVD